MIKVFLIYYIDVLMHRKMGCPIAEYELPNDFRFVYFQLGGAIQGLGVTLGSIGSR